MSKHCLHATGAQYSHGFGGRRTVQCCWCGERFQQEFKRVKRRIDGHGPRFKATVKEFEDIEEECPERTEDTI